MLIDVQAVQAFYENLGAKHRALQAELKRPLTYAEKVILSHATSYSKNLRRGETYIDTMPDRVAMQDATAQMAVLQFMLAQKETTAVPTTIHCDHLIQAKEGASKDLKTALLDNEEIYEFLRSAAQRYGMGFWKPGSGIIHQVLLENYAVPGMMMVGTDSHTPNAGGLGMLAIGVGGADAVDVMVGMPWHIRMPKLIGVRLSGKMRNWTAPKDVILHLAGLLSVKGGTGCIIEYFGPGASSISATGKATITNMGAELGATSSLFPYDKNMSAYLKATDRKAVAALADKYAQFLKADPLVEKNPKKFYDKVIDIDLSKLETLIAGPHTPDLVRPVSKISSDAKKNKYPEKISYALIGSCTNSSYEDLSKAADVAKQAAKLGLKVKCPLFITPGSALIRSTIERDGILQAFERIGAQVFANACGPCIGQWKRTDTTQSKPNTIITSFNRNFRRRNDGNETTHAFIGSPEVVTAFALAGTLGLNPLTDAIDGKKLKAPKGDMLPKRGFIMDRAGFNAPAKKAGPVIIRPRSERLCALKPFKRWDIANDFSDMRILLKAKGKCTTDHISPAGPWLRYRGHLDKISDNMFMGAINAFGNKEGKGTDLLIGKKGLPLSEIARHYKTKNIGWVVIAHENYGEGSSREHAAMEPRYLGCRAIIARSFARIAETNLKKQGVLPLTFVNAADYNLLQEEDFLTLEGLENLAPGSKIQLRVLHRDGSKDNVELTHSFSLEQIAWFKAGSALNMIREKK